MALTVKKEITAKEELMTIKILDDSNIKFRILGEDRSRMIDRLEGG